ncbi:hypothetical protein DIPPA_29456 [Diplonema papillatum]|nr:hypothetical protein DIPPA_29456 [Diplonema papillatum]
MVYGGAPAAPLASAPSAPSAPPAEEVLGDQPANPMMEQLARVLAKHEITIADASDLVALTDYRVIVVADDSGSMSFSNQPVSRRILGATGSTRWDELKNTLSTVLELVPCVVPTGMDLYFLNRPEVLGLRSIEDPRFAAAFSACPAGSTPLTQLVSRIVSEDARSDCEKPALVLIATDGEPNGGPAAFASLIESVVRKRVTSKTYKFQILACTDDDSSISWLNDLDERFKEVDVTDDYESEKKQILSAGKVASFKRSDWVIKALLGPICQKFDSIDEPAVRGGQKNQSGSIILFVILLAILAKLLKLA